MKKIIPILLLLGAAVSCGKKEELNSMQPKVVANDGKIAEAKQWFTSTHAASAGKKKELNWDKAVLETKQGVSRVYVPLKYTDRNFSSPSERFRLLITTDATGAKSASILHYIADNAYYKQHQSISTKDFTGIITEYDWNDAFMRGYKYVNARVVGDVSPISNDAYRTYFNQRKGLRTTDDNCAVITVVYYSQACSGGQCSDPVEVYRETFTTCATGGSGSTGGTGPSGDGGGNGGGGSGPIGGGGDPSGCGDQFICDDGTQNPKTNDDIKMENGFLVPLQIAIGSNTGAVGHHIEATIKVENNNITNVTSHMSGLTGGATYTQTDFVQNSVVGDTYTFSMAFYTSFSLNFFDIGNVGANNTVIAHVSYNLTNGSMVVFFENSGPH